jgi:ABC-2 type transport system permease protein
VTGTASVYDLGYRPYDGPRHGRTGARWALYRASVRRALGLRRSWRQKVLPWALLAIATIPAVVNVGVGYVTRDTPVEGFEFLTYRGYVGVSTALLLFVALVAPDIVCPDRRYRTLSLILSRPLSGLDYLAAKIGAIASIVFAFGVLPQVVLFVGQMLVDDAGALGYASDHLHVLWQVPVAVALLALYLSVLGVAVASLTTRRVVAAAVFLGGLLVSSAVSNIVQGPEPRGESYGELLNLLTIPLKLRDVVFLGHLSDDTSLSGTTGGAAWALVVYLGVVGVATVVLLARYRQVDA